MKEYINVTDDIKILMEKKLHRTKIFVVDGKKVVTLSNVKTDNYFYSKFAFDDNYIVAYTTGFMINPIPVDIVAAYSINNHKLIGLSIEKVKYLLEYMVVSQKKFNIANVLTEINDYDLKLLENSEKNNLKKFLTSGNNKITKEEVIHYITESYPILKKYVNTINHKLSSMEYLDIENVVGSTFLFHCMPQNLDFLNDRNNYDDIIISEYEEHLKLLKLRK